MQQTSMNFEEIKCIINMNLQSKTKFKNGDDFFNFLKTKSSSFFHECLEMSGFIS